MTAQELVQRELSTGKTSLTLADALKLAAELKLAREVDALLCVAPKGTNDVHQRV